MRTKEASGGKERVKGKRAGWKRGGGVRPLGGMGNERESCSCRGGRSVALFAAEKKEMEAACSQSASVTGRTDPQLSTENGPCQSELLPGRFGLACSCV